MTTQVGKWGNSLAVRIPGAFAKELDLAEGAEVEVTHVKDGLLLKRLKGLPLVLVFTLIHCFLASKGYTLCTPLS